MYNFEQWNGFKGSIWKEEVNVRDFIQKNYKPYDGDESFLVGPTEATDKLWGALQKLQKEERAKGGVLDMDTEIVSTLTSHKPGYIDEDLKDLEKVVGLQTDKPLKRAFTTGDTINSVIRAKIEELKSEDRIGTMQFFKCTLVMVEEVGGKDIPFSAITVEWLQKCEKLWSKTRSVSTIGMHMRNIRTLMNEAKRAGVIKESQYPFGKGLFEIKTSIGRKKGLTKKQLKAIFDYKSENETTNRYKDLWIFIYRYTSK